MPARKGPMTWREKLSLLLAGGLVCVISPAICSSIALTNAALAGKPSGRDEATLLAFYSALMPPFLSYVAALAGLVTCVFAVVSMKRNHEHDADWVGWETKYPAGRLSLVSSLVLSIASLIGALMIVNASSDHGFRAEILPVYTATTFAGTMIFGVPIIVLSALLDRDRKYFAPALIALVFSALVTVPFTVLFGRSLK